MGRGGYTPKAIDKARDELFSHIRRCGVLEAEDEQRSEWFDDTIEYLAERYPELTPDELEDLRTIGERYCAPAISRATRVEPETEEAVEETSDVESSTEEDTVDAGEVSAA